MGLTNEHVGPKILAKNKIYVLTRAELLFTLCYEIPCRWIKVDKQDYLKKGSHDFKNYFYFVIEKVASMPGTCQKLRLVFQPFRSRSRQCDYPLITYLNNRHSSTSQYASSESERDSIPTTQVTNLNYGNQNYSEMEFSGHSGYLEMRSS